MSEKSKYSALAGLREAQHQPTTGMSSPSDPLLTAKPPKLQGKRSDPEWKQFSVLLKKESHRQAAIILRQKYEGNDLSDLMQALLEQWLRSEQT